MLLIETIPLVPAASENQIPRVAVVFPSGEFVNVNFVMSLLNHKSQNGSYHICNMINTSSCRIAFNRNLLVELALKTTATHILFIDSDMIFPPWAGDVLIAHNLDIVGATASKRDDEQDSAIGDTLDGSRLQIPSPPVKMRLLGMPFMLIKMDVFRKLTKPWFAEPPRAMMEVDDTGSLMPEDEYFCFRAIEAGYDVYCDINLSTNIGHRGAKTFNIMKPTKE